MITTGAVNESIQYGLLKSGKTCMNIFPYVYKLTHKINGTFYFGVRWANKVSSKDDLGVFYFTSSPKIKINFSDFSYEIISEFLSKEEAYDFEQKLISNNSTNPLILNRWFQRNGAKRFIPNAHTSDKQKLVASATFAGKPKSKDHKIKISNALKGKRKTHEHLENYRNSRSETWTIINVFTEEIFITNRLKEWCEAREFYDTPLRRSSKFGFAYKDLLIIKREKFTPS